MTDKISPPHTQPATPKTPNRSALIAKLRFVTLTGYFGLLILMPLWLVWINPPINLNINISLTLFWVPLWFPCIGLIKGTPYTYAWANFVVMLNFMHGLTTLWVIPEDLIWASLEVLFATMMFFAGTYYARFKGQELGQKLPKLADLP